MAPPDRRIRCADYDHRSSVNISGWGRGGRIHLASTTVVAGMSIGAPELRELAGAALARAIEIEAAREENH